MISEVYPVRASWDGTGQESGDEGEVGTGCASAQVMWRVVEEETGV